MKKTNVLTLRHPPRFLCFAAVGGREESVGQIGKHLDFCDPSDCFGQSSWERAEGEMSRVCLNFALKKGRLSPEDLSVLFAGDLQNQCVASSGGLYSFGVPYIGLYGACSTCTEAIVLLSLYLCHCPGSAGAALTSSHNCAAERQFRTPIEYGAQRSPSAQWTASAAGAFILGGEDVPARESEEGCPVFVSRLMPGKIVDSGVKDPANMGAAMAPAAAHSILCFLREGGYGVNDFDAVFTGDLGQVGSSLLLSLLSDEGISLSQRHRDCGCMLYDTRKQDVHAGASGCGCSAALLAAHVLPAMRRGEYRRVLFLSTGALMSPDSIKQGGTILGIAPAILLESGSNAP